MPQRRSQVTGTSIVGLIVSILIGTACVFGPVDKPTVSVLSPTNNLTLRRGQAVMVQSVSISRSGIKYVELWVNGELIDTKRAQLPRSFTAIQSWTPQVEGTYRIEIRAFDNQARQNDPIAISVTVISEGGDDSDFNVDPQPETTIPSVTAKTNLNIRAGPDTAFAILRTLKSAESAQIIGSNPDRSWWQIAYSGASSGTGWVLADEKYSTTKNADTVPVVDSPSLPTASTPIPAVTPSPPTNLPQIHYFRADKLNIIAGENVLLSWDLDGAQAAYLYPGGEGGIVAPGNLRVSPGRTTTYRLIARNQYGENEVLLTITVQ